MCYFYVTFYCKFMYIYIYIYINIYLYIYIIKIGVTLFISFVAGGDRLSYLVQIVDW